MTTKSKTIRDVEEQTVRQFNAIAALTGMSDAALFEDMIKKYDKSAILPDLKKMSDEADPKFSKSVDAEFTTEPIDEEKIAEERKKTEAEKSDSFESKVRKEFHDAEAMAKTALENKDHNTLMVLKSVMFKLATSNDIVAKEAGEWHLKIKEALNAQSP